MYEVVENSLEDVGVDDGLVDNFSVESDEQSEYFQVDTASDSTDSGVEGQERVEGGQVEGQLFQQVLFIIPLLSEVEVLFHLGGEVGGQD